MINDSSRGEILSKKENTKMHILQFQGYWDNVLLIYLENSTKLIESKKAPECKSQMIADLVRSYINFSIEHSLLKIFEVVKMIGTFDKTWSSDKKFQRKGVPKSVMLLIDARNILLAHIQESLGSEKQVNLINEISKTNYKIIEDIKVGVQEILDKIESLNLGTPVYSDPLREEFSASEIDELALFKK